MSADLPRAKRVAVKIRSIVIIATQVLIVENAMTLTSYAVDRVLFPEWERGGGVMSALQTKVCEVIDSSWHFSWHWKKDDIGYLTLEGWKEARRDALGLRASLLRRIQEIEAILPKIEEEIAKRERWAKQDAESMETVP